MVELATPWALLALPLPLFVYWFANPARVKTRSGLIIPHFDMINGLPSKQQRGTSQLPWWLICSWIFIIAAASGPRWVGERMPLTQAGHSIFLALDISGSMAINDMQWNHRPTSRLQVVKQAAIQFVQDRPSDKIGLILFGTRAYVQTPLTYDKHTILLRLEDASVGLAGNSTSLGDPLGLAVKHLQQTAAEGRLIILLTDGANNSGVLSVEKASQLARDNGIKIYTIGLGAPATYLPISHMELDEKALQKIAADTGGRYFRATDQTSLQQIYALINAIETTPQEQYPIRPQRDYYPWPLGLAFCLLLGGLLQDAYAQRRVSQ